MKKAAIFPLALLLLSIAGCSRNDYVGAGGNQGGDVSSSSAATSQDYGQRASFPSEPAANGGSSLQASDPYTHGNGTTISQNLNPAPFMGSSQAGLRGENPKSASTSLSTNRAVGEMEGATDQPPGAIAPGEMGPVRQTQGLSPQPFPGIGLMGSSAGKAGVKPKPKGTTPK